jgi:hypothetical protein
MELYIAFQAPFFNKENILALGEGDILTLVTGDISTLVYHNNRSS